MMSYPNFVQGEEGFYVGKLRLHQLHSLIILGHILKCGLLKSRLFLLLSRPLILYRLRTIHPLILLEVVGVLIIRIVPSLNNNIFSSPMHNPTSITGWELSCSDGGDLGLSSHKCLNLQCQNLHLFFQFSLGIIFLHLGDAFLHNPFIH